MQRLCRSLWTHTARRCSQNNRRLSAIATLRSARELSTHAVENGPIRVCVVGSGPAGFYTTKYLLKEHPDVHVDMLEALPTPFGLVRSGVAPDHPEVKSVINDFEKVAAEDRFAFLGNVNVGQDIRLDELQDRYHAIVLAYGAAGDRTLGVPGEHLSNVHSARAFVNWYNGHPAFRDLNPDLSSETAVIFGQGNVAVDCARILTKSIDELAVTDISQHAIDALRASRIKKVYLVGRRGSAQAAFTMKELRELTKLDDVACVVNPNDLKNSQNESSLKEIASHRAKKRMNELLTKIAAEYSDASTSGKRQVEIKFLAAPVEILADPNHPERVGKVRIEKTRLEGEPDKQKAVGTGELEEIPCGLVLRSIGYKSHPIDDVPFDSKRHVVSNEHGRVVDPITRAPVTGLYCSGWLKRGPSGIIGTNIVDARETVSSIVEDAAQCKLFSPSKTGGLRNVIDLIRSRHPTKQLVQWGDVATLDQEELRRGATLGKSREKITCVDEMLKIVAAPQSSA